MAGVCVWMCITKGRAYAEHNDANRNSGGGSGLTGSGSCVRTVRLSALSVGLFKAVDRYVYAVVVVAD